MTTQTTSPELALTQGTWTLDPNHSGVHFRIRHLGLSNVRGRFDRFTASLGVGQRIEDTSVEATIEMASVDTNQPDRDAHLKSTDFFSAEQHPEMTFRSTAVRARSDGEYEMTGDLTINGITRSVTLDVEFNGIEDFPGDGKTHAGFSATGEINRMDFGVCSSVPIGGGLASDKVRIEIEAGAVLRRQM